MIDRRRVLRYSKAAAERASELRRNMTIAEAMLWPLLKGRAIRGYDFHRKKAIGDFIVDFFCARLMLVLEIDGESHRQKAERDAERQVWLEKAGVRFLRFTDEEVRRDPRAVARAIEGWIVEAEREIP